MPPSRGPKRALGAGAVPGSRKRFKESGPDTAAAQYASTAGHLLTKHFLVRWYTIDKLDTILPQQLLMSITESKVSKHKAKYRFVP
jgi:hypothetical protein